MIDWRQRIRERLAEKDWSVQTLSRRSGVPSDTLAKWLSGKKSKRTSSPRVSHALAVAKALGLSVESVFDPETPWLPGGSAGEFAADLRDPELTEAIHRLVTPGLLLVLRRLVELQPQETPMGNKRKGR